jgi:hypothetical protein
MRRTHFKDTTEVGKSPGSDLKGGRDKASPMNPDRVNPDQVSPHVAVFA